MLCFTVRKTAWDREANQVKKKIWTNSVLIL
jgi:hypothetical protein